MSGLRPEYTACTASKECCRPLYAARRILHEVLHIQDESKVGVVGTPGRTIRLATANPNIERRIWHENGTSGSCGAVNRAGCGRWQLRAGPQTESAPLPLVPQTQKVLTILSEVYRESLLRSVHDRGFLY